MAEMNIGDWIQIIGIFVALGLGVWANIANFLQNRAARIEQGEEHERLNNNLRIAIGNELMANHWLCKQLIESLNSGKTVPFKPFTSKLYEVSDNSLHVYGRYGAEIGKAYALMDGSNLACQGFNQIPQSIKKGPLLKQLELTRVALKEAPALLDKFEDMMAFKNSRNLFAS